jgi:hypothetical protein
MMCEERFYGWKVAAAFSFNAHCPRCGNFDLEHISRERVETGTLITVKRWLGFPAYRCDPCRFRFFSIRPFRRIMPSVAAAPASPGTAAADKGWRSTLFVANLLRDESVPSVVLLLLTS